MFKIEQHELNDVAGKVRPSDQEVIDVNGVTITIGFAQTPDGAFIIVSSDAGASQGFRLWKARKQPDPKAQVRADTSELVATYLARQGKITTDRPGQSGNGFSARDWSRQQKGLKVATGEEIAAERDRRALKAIANRDFTLVEKLVTFQFDKVIKFDIEEGRLGANGEIR